MNKFEIGEEFHIATATRLHRHWVTNRWDEVKEDYTNAETGKQATRQEILDWLDDLEQRGYNVVPPCDNISEDGTCAGHKVTN